MNNNLFVHCEDANIEASKGIIKVMLTNVCFYSLYMNNNMSNILKEIPIEELEKHIAERKEEDK